MVKSIEGKIIDSLEDLEKAKPRDILSINNSLEILLNSAVDLWDKKPACLKISFDDDDEFYTVSLQKGAVSYTKYFVDSQNISPLVKVTYFPSQKGDIFFKRAKRILTEGGLLE